MKTDIYPISPVQILEALPVALFAVDHELRMTYCNKNAEGLTGGARAKALGKKYSDVFPITFVTDSCPLLSCMESGEPCSDSHGILLWKTKQHIKVRLSTAALRSEKNTIIGCVAVMQPEEVFVSDYSSMQCAVQACEVESIITALRRNNNNRTAAARDLGIHKSTFFRKIKKMGIDLPHIDGRFRH